MNGKHVAIVLLALAGVFLAGIGVVVLPFLLQLWEVRRSEWHMQQPAVYQPIARDLAAYCAAADDIAYPERGWGAPWAPASVRSLHASYFFVKRDDAMVGMGGGFHHWGYTLSRDPATSTDSEDAWVLTMDIEDQPDKVLYSFSQPVSAKISKARFLIEALAGYDEMIAAWSGDEERIAEKASFLLEYAAAPDAWAAVDAAFKAYPENWWLQLVHGAVLARRGDPHAADDLKRWVDGKPSFSRYLVLAQFHLFAGDPAAAGAAADKAATFRPDDPPDVAFNAAYRGYSVAYHLDSRQQYAAAIHLCDALRFYRPNPYTAEIAELARHAQAAESTPRSVPAPLAVPQTMLDPWPQIEADFLDRLAG